MLPQNQPLNLMQTSWASQLNPLINNTILNGLQLSGVSLINGSTVINHKLGRNQQGWFITDINGAASIYRSAQFNALTLTLISDAAVVVDIWVF